MNKFIDVPVGVMSLSKKRLVHGVGVNDSENQVRVIIDGKIVLCQFYHRWTTMLKRCYSAKSLATAPRYVDCTVCNEWLTFSKFKAWMIKQDWEGNQLDKDILIQGNKIYRPEACLFVTPQINSLLGDSKAIRGKYSIGVGLIKESGKYRAQVKVNGKQTAIGNFNTPEEAFSAYKNAKYAIIKRVAIKQVEPLKSALLNYVIVG
jgi:hypothetical protein